jgi:cobalt transporter subunit CbtB
MPAIPETTHVLPAADAPRTQGEALAAIGLATLLGALLLYGAGFASDVRLHNAAHDARHAAGFPCN